MSDAKTCDGCGATLVLDSKGEDRDGEIAAWVRLQVATVTFDACSRGCAVKVLERDDVIAMHDSWTASVMEVANVIKGGHDVDDEEGEPDGDGDGTP